jgi:hypothetical protein
MSSRDKYSNLAVGVEDVEQMKRRMERRAANEVGQASRQPLKM